MRDPRRNTRMDSASIPQKQKTWKRRYVFNWSGYSSFTLRSFYGTVPLARLNFSQLVCPDQDLFHCLRDNFVDNIDIAAQWMVDFKNMSEIKFVTSMMNLENQPTFHEVEKEWNRIRYSIKTIDVPFLLQSQRPVPRQYLKPQYTHKK